MIKAFESFNAFKSYDFSKDLDIIKVHTIGHTIPSIGAAEYVKVPSSNYDTENEAEFTSADGTIWRIINKPITPEHFGAIPNNNNLKNIATKNTKAINTFFEYISETDVGVAMFTGNFTIDNALFFGKNKYGINVEEIATKHIVGSPNIYLKTKKQIDTILTINGFGSADNKKSYYWEGIIHINGAETKNWSKRNAVFGIKLFKCSQATFGGFNCSNIASYGVLYSSKNQTLTPKSNHINIGNCNFKNCGSGYQQEQLSPEKTKNDEKYFMSSKWLKKALPLNKDIRYTKLTVDKLPDAVMLEQARIQPFILFSNGELVEVKKNSINYIDNSVIIKPCINPKLTDQNIKWVFGGGIIIKDINISIIKINSINARFCALGIDILSKFGPTIGLLNIKSCYAGYANCPSIPTESSIQSFSCENKNQIPFIINQTHSTTNISSMINVDLEYIKYINYRLPNGTITNYTPLKNTFNHNGNLLSYEKDNQNRTEVHSRINYIIQNKNQIQTYQKNDAIVELNINEKYNKVFGYDSGLLHIIGEYNSELPSRVSFVTNKETKYKVNNADLFEFSEFEKSALFSIFFDFKNKNFKVALIN